MPSRTRQFVRFVTAVFLVGCAMHQPRSGTTVEQHCLEGAAYGFVDTLAAPDAPRGPNKMWLVLDAGMLNGGPERRAKTIAEKDFSTLAAAWKMVGDSIVVQHLTFPPAEWVLHESGNGLRGRLHSETDNISTDAQGGPEKHRDDWPVLLNRIDCGTVAQPSKTR